MEKYLKLTNVIFIFNKRKTTSLVSNYILLQYFNNNLV